MQMSRWVQWSIAGPCDASKSSKFAHTNPHTLTLPQDEIYDMVGPASHKGITLPLLLDSGCASAVVDILTSSHGFYMYDNRESLMHQDDEQS